MQILSFNRILSALSIMTLAAVPSAYAQDGAVYPSPEEAVSAFVSALRSNDPAESLIKVIGETGRSLARSGDDVDDEARRSKFLAAFDDAHSLQADGDEKQKLIIGKEDYPFPIPLVKDSGTWRWDVEAGLDEILTRRIGENELSAIKVMQAFVAAQLEYAEQPRDGKGIQYARRLMSREGRKDGLYWEARAGEDESPIGPLIAKAQSEGYRGQAKREDGYAAYHGYHYRMLYGQGRNASDGRRDYIVNDRMIGGFALIAVPADYGNSGIMTLIVNQDGVVYEKDLGPQTVEDAARIKLFDPNTSWRKVNAD